METETNTTAHAGCTKGQPCETWTARIHAEDPIATLPVHKRPTSCHVCGAAVPERGGATRPDCRHDLTNAEALAAANEYDRRARLARTPEAAYVAQHRPY